MDHNQKLAAIIRAARIQAGVSAKEFAEACGVSTGYINMLEASGGRSSLTGRPIDIRESTMEKLASGLGITQHQLLDLIES